MAIIRSVVGAFATTRALVGAPSMKDISPKYWPGVDPRDLMKGPIISVCKPADRMGSSVIHPTTKRGLRTALSFARTIAVETRNRNLDAGDASAAYPLMSIDTQDINPDPA